MLTAVLILSIISILLSLILLAGFWDVYKTLRKIKGLVSISAQEASKHLQKVAKGADPNMSKTPIGELGKKRA